MEQLVWSRQVIRGRRQVITILCAAPLVLASAGDSREPSRLCWRARRQTWTKTPVVSPFPIAFVSAARKNTMAGPVSMTDARPTVPAQTEVYRDRGVGHTSVTVWDDHRCIMGWKNRDPRLKRFFVSHSARHVRHGRRPQRTAARSHQHEFRLKGWVFPEEVWSGGEGWRTARFARQGRSPAGSTESTAAR